MELIPLNPDQHVVAFVPKLTTELPFFNLTSYQKNLPTVIKFSGVDELGHPIHWAVYQNTNREIGSPRSEAHRVWYQLVLPAADEARRPDGTIPQIIPLGKIRECLRKIDWTAGGHQERKLIRSLNQIGAAWCVADLWIPLKTTDELGRPEYVQVKGRFSRLSVYAIGERHVTEEELKNLNFDFDLEDILYIRLDPLEARMQQAPDRRLYDNQYWFSVDPAARRWYELLAPKIFGVLKNKAAFCEINYLWYVQHHHTLKRFYERRRVVEQMNRLVKDHLVSGYLTRVEYRAIKEPDKEIDYIIRYYPGEAAKKSIARIQGHFYRRRSSTFVQRAPKPTKLAQESRLGSSAAPATVPAVELGLITQRDAQDQQLLMRLFREFGVAMTKAFELVKNKREETINQLQYWPYRSVQIKGGLAGWMITAILRDYPPPPGYAEDMRQQLEAATAQARLVLITTCPHCDDRGFIKVQSKGQTGHGTVRLCTHNPGIENRSTLSASQLNKAQTPPDAQNAPQMSRSLIDEENTGLSKPTA